MKILVHKKVDKDAEKMPESIKALVAENLTALMKAENLSELKNVIPVEGTDEPYYRMKIRTYRLLIEYIKETKTVKVHALTHRKDTYKKENLPWRK